MRAESLSWLGLSAQDFGPCYGEEFSHAQFAAAWRGTVPCPSEAEILAATPPTPEPMPPIEQIRAIERTPEVADAMQRGSRLVALAYALDDLIRVAAAKGQTVTRTQAHAWAMVNDANYKTLYDAEQTIKPLRALV